MCIKLAFLIESALCALGIDIVPVTITTVDISVVNFFFNFIRSPSGHTQDTLTNKLGFKASLT